MTLLRSLLFNLAVLLLTLVWGSICLLTAFLPYRARFAITTCWNRAVVWLAKVICGIHYQVIGYDNLPDEPVILLSKHQSAWETIFLLYSMPRRVVFVMKKELLRIPFFGWALGLMKMIPIDRNDGTKAFRRVIEKGKERIAEGLCIVIFPEGTRIPVGQKGKYRNSGTRLAIETKTSVVPIALNSGEYWPSKSFIKKPGIITVSIGKPISSEGISADEMMQQAENWIESEMQRISPDAYKHR